MKGSFFNNSLEWQIEVEGESWQQGALLKGQLKVKNHGGQKAELTDAGIGLAHAEIKKVHARKENALKLEQKLTLTDPCLDPGAMLEFPFEFKLDENCPVTDKKASYYLTYGRGHQENHLQLKLLPRETFQKLVSLLDTFFRFKLKEYKTAKAGVEYKLLPPTSRDMANIESLSVTLCMAGENLKSEWVFQVKKLDTSGVTTKLNKESLKLVREFTPRQYSLGPGMLNQEVLLKAIEEVLGEVKMKAVF
jgi:hypothetical protein